MREGKVDITIATAEPVDNALGFSIVVGRRIVSYRQHQRRYTAISQLLLIPVAQITHDRIKEFVTVCCQRPPVPAATGIQTPQ